jgi:lipid-A-disaccharide synthase
MVIAYNMNCWQIMKRKHCSLGSASLPNIFLCRDFVVPELLQDQATPEALAQALHNGRCNHRSFQPAGT